MYIFLIHLDYLIDTEFLQISAGLKDEKMLICVILV